MYGKLSRRKISAYVADQVKDGVIPETVLKEVGAYLYEERRLRELGLIVRAIEDALYERGIVIATVTSAQPLDEQLRAIIIERINAGSVYLREEVDPSVIGGLRLQTPEASMDSTLVHKLKGLAAAKM